MCRWFSSEQGGAVPTCHRCGHRSENPGDTASNEDFRSPPPRVRNKSGANPARVRAAAEVLRGGGPVPRGGQRGPGRLGGVRGPAGRGAGRSVGGLRLAEQGDAAVAANRDCFGAPTALFCHIDRDMGPAQWADLGMHLADRHAAAPCRRVAQLPADGLVGVLPDCRRGRIALTRIDSVLRHVHRVRGPGHVSRPHRPGPARRDGDFRRLPTQWSPTARTAPRPRPRPSAFRAAPGCPR